MDTSYINFALCLSLQFVTLRMRQEPFTMYAILVMFILRTYGAYSQEVKISNEVSESKDNLEFSDSDKSYQYVDPAALLTVTPFINQRILTDSPGTYERGGGPNIYYPESRPLPQSPPLPISKNVEIRTIVDANPLLAALLLSSILGIEPKSPGFNHPQHLPTNPYIALLLSHYGRYIPLYGAGRGIYGYSAANNYHNNKPFGAYKIYEDRDT